MQEAYEQLKIWRIAMHLLERVYRRTTSFPSEEKSGLVSTLRKSAAAIAARIADGAQDDDAAGARGHFHGDTVALRDLEIHLLLCRRLRLINTWELRMMRRRCHQIKGLLREELLACAEEIAAVSLPRAA